MTHFEPTEMCPTSISDDIKAYFVGLPKGPTYVEEAEYGLRSVLPWLRQLPAGARVLEVGSGPCILLAELVARYPDWTICGIEPMGDGFAFFDDFIRHMRDGHANLNIHLGGYESFPDTGRWDLIFLVNVFEHLPDWNDFIDFVDGQLAPGGKCVILCPNYGFPFESHFGLPIIWNKKITGMLFSRYIRNYESRNDLKGLWRSLNFVKLSGVRKALRNRNLQLSVDTAVIRNLIDRLDTDVEFRRRQGFLGRGASVLRRTGVIDQLIRVAFFQNFLPYMRIILSKPD